jgi:hypothetical protein
MDIHDPTVLGREDTDRLKAASVYWVLPKRAPNLDSFLSLHDKWQVFAVLGVLVVLCAVYGGVHLSTCNFDFPTPIEQKLWRIACILTVAGSPLAPWFVYWSNQVFYEESFSVGIIIEMLADVFEVLRGSGSFWVCLKLVFSLPVCFAVLFSPLLASRIFLVVESFISLRDVPSGVYATVPWAQYIPHI